MPNQLLHFAKAMRHQPTAAENALWRQLRSNRLLGHKFKRQQPIGNYIVDFVCFEQRLIVEVDGGQHVDNASGDSDRSAWLASQGFRVLRFWNDDVLTKETDVLEAIIGALRSLPLPNPSSGLAHGTRALIGLRANGSQATLFAHRWRGALRPPSSQTHQMMTRLSGATYILSPGLTPYAW